MTNDTHARSTVAAALARGLGADWSLSAVLERCRQTLRAADAGYIAGSPCPVPAARATAPTADRVLSSAEMREPFDVTY